MNSRERSRQKLVETCPKCGTPKRQGSLTSWIFSSESTSQCGCAKAESKKQHTTTTSSRSKAMEESFGKLKMTSSGKTLGSTDKAVELEETVIAGRYVVEELVGVGGMGSVFRAEDMDLEKTFAIKILRPDLSSEPSSLKRFEQEAKAVSTLTHPNLVSVYDYGISDKGCPFIVMDYLDGRGLDVVIDENVYLEPARMVDIFIQVVDAVCHAHGKRIIHRDIKPSNIIILKSEDGAEFVKIVDFGIAKVLPEGDKKTNQLTQTGEVFGSPYYMSPEQCAGHKLDNRSDIYSIGCVMYESLTGKPPFEGNNPIQTILKHLNEEPKDLKLGFSSLEIPASLAYIVMRCLAKDAGDRYQTAEELQADLIAYRDGKDFHKVVLNRRKHKAGTIGNLAFQSRAVLVLVCLSLFGLIGAGFLVVSGVLNPAPMAGSLDERWSGLDKLGQECFDRGDYKGARSYFEEELRIAESGPGSPKLVAASLSELLDLTRSTGDLSEAALLQQRLSQLADQALERVGRIEKQLDAALKGEYSGDPGSKLEYYSDLGNRANDLIATLVGRGMQSDAQRLLEKTTKMVRGTLGEENMVMARCILNTGYTYHERGELEKAQPLYKKALDLSRKISNGSEHVTIGTALARLGRLGTQLSLPPALVEGWLKEALTIFRHTVGSDSEKVAHTHYSLAEFYWSVGDRQKTVDEADAALTLYEQLPDGEPCDVARCYYLKGNATGNKEDFRKALELFESEPKKDFFFLSQTLLQYGVLIARDDPATTRTLLNRALALSYRMGAKDEQRVKSQIYSELANLSRQESNFKSAEAFYEKSLKASESGYGKDDFRTLEIIGRLAALYDDQRNVEKASEYFEKALVLISRNRENKLYTPYSESILSRYEHFLKQQGLTKKLGEVTRLSGQLRK